MGIKPITFYHKEFVKLVDVVWPLADVHDPVHKMNYERLLPIHGSDGRQRRLPVEIYNALKVMAQWVVSQIELIGELCVSRSVNCTEYLKSEYNFDLIITGMLDLRYPVEVRGAFARVCNNIYVDHVLHINLEPPLEVRLLIELPKLESTEEEKRGWLDTLCCGYGTGAKSPRSRRRSMLQATFRQRASKSRVRVSGALSEEHKYALLHHDTL